MKTILLKSLLKLKTLTCLTYYVTLYYTGATSYIKVARPLYFVNINI